LFFVHPAIFLNTDLSFHDYSPTKPIIMKMKNEGARDGPKKRTRSQCLYGACKNLATNQGSSQVTPEASSETGTDNSAKLEISLGCECENLLWAIIVASAEGVPPPKTENYPDYLGY
jgi:hypothetical protein